MCGTFKCVMSLRTIEKILNFIEISHDLLITYWLNSISIIIYKARWLFPFKHSRLKN